MLRFLKGWFGEQKTTFSMWLSLDQKVYRRFHDVIIPSSNGTTQIDHILISQYGIFIVETKNKTGWIFGSENQAEWTQSIYGKKYSFQNPLRQAYRQKKILADFLNVRESFIHTVIYFVGDCKFKTELPANVLRSGLGSYVKNFESRVFQQDEVDKFVIKIEKHTSESTLTTSDHVRSLGERHSSTTVCPRCGGGLTLKEAKKGPKAGSKFYGCGNYPRCRFTRKAEQSWW